MTMSMTLPGYWHPCPSCGAPIPIDPAATTHAMHWCGSTLGAAPPIQNRAQRRAKQKRGRR